MSLPSISRGLRALATGGLIAVVLTLPAISAQTAPQAGQAPPPGTQTPSPGTQTVAPGDPVAPRITIVEPAADGFLVGPTSLQAVLAPADTPVTSVEFFVDGVLACRIEAAPYACDYDAGTTVAAHTVRAVANFPDGGRVAATVVTKTAHEIQMDTGVSAVLVPVVVKDWQERFVQGLKKESFRIFENNVPQIIRHFQPENVPLDVVIAVDVSGSMSDSMPKLKTAVKRFLDTLSDVSRAQAKVNITVIAFNDRVSIIAKPDTSLAAAKSAVDELTAYGGTSLYDTMLKSFDLLGHEISRKAVIVFTDGDDRTSLAAIDPVERRIHDSDATVYMITLGKSAQMLAVRKIVDHLSDISGGKPLPIDKIDQLEKALDYVKEDLTHQYLVGYEPANAVHDGTYRKIVVKTTQESHTVRHRDGYTAPVK
jgi:VWFA-related protein